MASTIFALVACLIALPRPTYPQVIPLPRVDLERKDEREKEETSRAARAKDGSLSKAVRAVGEQVRRVGFQLTKGGTSQDRLLETLRIDSSALLRSEGPQHLQQLRALQAELFLLATHEWEENEAPLPPSRSLHELGGDFAHVARSAWMDERGRLLLDDDALRLFYRIRWGKLTGLHGHPAFGPSLEEYRRYFKTNLMLPASSGGDPKLAFAAQLSHVHVLSRVDPKYPGELAAGMLQLQLGQPLAAQSSLESHLNHHPNGSWSNIARNHLLLALKQAEQLTPGFH